MAEKVVYNDPTPNNFPDDYDDSKVDSRVKIRSKSIAHKDFGVHVREALMQGIEIGSVVANEAKNIANDTASRQDESEKIVQNTSDNVNNVLSDITNNAGDSAAPEVIAARDDGRKTYQTLKQRLNQKYKAETSYISSDNVDDLFKNEVDRVLAEIDTTKFNFAVNTDNHYQERTTYGNFLNAPKTQHLGMRHYANLLALGKKTDLILLGGDNNHPDYKNINVGKKDLMTICNKILDNETGSDRFILPGNHDVGDSLKIFNGIGKVKLNEIISQREQKEYYRTAECKFGEIRNGDSLYFYKDYPAKKIRFIGIQTEDTRELVDSNGYIKYTTLNTHVISQEQMNWIANTALMTTPTDYSVVMFGHAFPAEDSPIAGNGDKDWNFGILADIINAWKNGKSYAGAGAITDYPISVIADFSKRGNGKFVGYFCGHEHTERMYDFHGFKVCILMHSMCNPGPNKEERIADTLSEDAESVVSVDTANRTVNIYGFGAAHDRNFSY